jgi:hypothetical protein
MKCTTNYRQMEMICGPVPLGLDLDELVVFVLPGVDLLESRAIRKSRSYYGGPTIRLAKGLSLRLGAGTSQSESYEELRNIDNGTLVLTTKRLVFMGSLRTSNVMLNDLVGVKPYTDGIQVHRERKERAETYMLNQSLQILEGPGQGLTVSGPMIMGAIQLAKTYHEQPIAALTSEARPTKPIFRAEIPGASPLQYGSLHSS